MLVSEYSRRNDAPPSLPGEGDRVQLCHLIVPAVRGMDKLQ